MPESSPSKRLHEPVIAKLATDNQTQGDAQSDATDEHTDLTALVKTVTDARITIQFAAETEYPYPNPANAAA